MAWMNQEKKAKIKTEVDKVLKGTGIKYSLAVRNRSTVVLNISKGPVDFISNFYETTLPKASHNTHTETPAQRRNTLDVNPYWYKEHFTGKVLEIVEGCMKALNLDNFDKSDIQSDYFNVGHYVDMNIGKWDKPYELVTE